jgi:hypothetical protein
MVLLSISWQSLLQARNLSQNLRRVLLDAVFYDQNWQDSGIKRALAASIASITGIDRKLLSGEAEIDNYSVVQKMSWASMRDTTRVEDMAYSLLGIFGINMPRLYGEGLKSFARLQEEIIKTSEDQTLFAWRMGWLNVAEHDFDHGMLASSPADIRESGRVVQVAGQNFDDAKCWITNRGLLIDLPVYQEEDKFVAVLNCHDIDHSNTRLRILLQKSTFAAGNTSNLDPLGIIISPQRVICRRVAPDLLRNVQAELVSNIVIVFLTINTIWVSPTSRGSRFPIVDVSLECDMGETGFFLVNSSSLLAHDSSRRLMCYTFSNSAKTSFGVKLQVDGGVKGAVRLAWKLWYQVKLL